MTRGGNRSGLDGAELLATEFMFAGGWGYQTEYASGTDGLGLQQRHHDPAVGRFIPPDPIGFAGGLNPWRAAALDR